MSKSILTFALNFITQLHSFMSLVVDWSDDALLRIKICLIVQVRIPHGSPSVRDFPRYSGFLHHPRNDRFDMSKTSLLHFSSVAEWSKIRIKKAQFWIQLGKIQACEYWPFRLPMVGDFCLFFVFFSRYHGFLHLSMTDLFDISVAKTALESTLTMSNLICYVVKYFGGCGDWYIINFNSVYVI